MRLGSCCREKLFYGLIQRLVARDPTPYQSIMGEKSGKWDSQVFDCGAMQSVSEPTTATPLTTIYSGYLSQVHTPIADFAADTGGSRRQVGFERRKALGDCRVPASVCCDRGKLCNFPKDDRRSGIAKTPWFRTNSQGVERLRIH